MVPAIRAVTDVETSAQRPSVDEKVAAAARAEQRQGCRKDAADRALQRRTATPKFGLVPGCARTAPQHHIPRRQLALPMLSGWLKSGLHFRPPRSRVGEETQNGLL